MSTETYAEVPAPVAESARWWPPALRIGFRFAFVYFLLFVVFIQIFNSIFPIPDFEVPDYATLWPIRPGIIWVAKHLFGVRTDLVYSGSGSGDKTFDWVLVFCILAASVVAAAIWSLLDRRRQGYTALSRWFHLLLRIALGSQMFVYGFSKAVALQMPLPSLSRQVEPIGHLSPMGVLWTSIGAAPAYEIFAGCAEIAGGILLIFPRTVTLGALICLADMVEVFLLNMTYDVPVKLFSFHLILMSLLLLAPQARRIANFFLLNRTALPLPEARLFESRRANGITVAVVAFLWLWMIGNNVYSAWSGWREYGGGSPKSALYGIWEIEQFVSDGQARSPLLTDNGRLRRAIFDHPTSMTFQHMDDALDGYRVAIDVRAGTLALTKLRDKNWKANFTYRRPAQDRLILDGTMEGHKLHMECRAAEPAGPLYVTRGFHWISEYPFNR